ncbi:MAG: DeoR/GlpR family DNA-binding transcription regulator [Pirellulales bacterium]|jgi:DeoR family fructose operon transcriptional repressor
MLVDDRRSRLLELVRLRGFAALPDLASELQVSESTVRRDLDYLEETGSAKRTHGGVFYTGPSPKLHDIDRRQEANWGRKRAIARAAAPLIEDNDTVVLGGGSTVYELARLLVGRPLQIVTNSLPVANLFTSSDSADLVMIGGYVHTRTGVSVGPYAEHMLAELTARRAVLSVAGVTERGFFNSNLLLVETERAMMRAADEVVVVADSTKFGRTSLARLCELSDIDTLVVDQGLDTKWLDCLHQAGVRVVVANESTDHAGGSA